ncbi:MAG: restriction endonuclease [Flavipsychrobacter sp.]|jgi:hypothetical protein|nr:restriction endonuclease [Flavipsychrobacter sp.]
MPKLSWISDDILIAETNKLLGVARSAKEDASKKFGKNVVDPFSAIFEMSGFDVSYDVWVKTEEARQAQKTLQNFIGEFHQNVLSACAGWTNLGKGNVVDLVNTNKKIIAEVKNKFNTLSGGKLAGLYQSLDTAVMHKNSKYKGYTAYYVTIIPPKPKRFDVEFTPSDNETGSKRQSNSKIRHIDGASFYTLATGSDSGLEDLFDVLPSIINDIIGKNKLDSSKLKKLFSTAYGE